MRNRKFVFTPKIEYQLAAERSEANPSNLQFPTWCSILKIVRTHFAACGGEEVPPRKFGKAAEPHRSKPQKNPEKNIGSNHILILGEENFLTLCNNKLMEQEKMKIKSLLSVKIKFEPIFFQVFWQFLLPQRKRQFQVFLWWHTLAAL